MGKDNPNILLFSNTFTQVRHSMSHALSGLDQSYLPYPAQNSESRLVRASHFTATNNQFKIQSSASFGLHTFSHLIISSSYELSLVQAPHILTLIISSSYELSLVQASRSSWLHACLGRSSLHFWNFLMSESESCVLAMVDLRPGFSN